MGKIKKWFKDHKVEIMIYGTVIASVALGGYLGYKAGKEAGRVEGFGEGFCYIPEHALLETKAVDEEFVSQGHHHCVMDCVRYDSNQGNLSASLLDMMNAVQERGGDLERTALIAVSVTD